MCRYTSLVLSAVPGACWRQQAQPQAALKAFGAAKQLAVGSPAAGWLRAQGPAAAPQAPNRRHWPRHGLECPLQSHMASPPAASTAEARMPVFAGGSLPAGGPGPRIIGSSWTRNFQHWPPGMLGCTGLRRPACGPWYTLLRSQAPVHPAAVTGLIAGEPDVRQRTLLGR